MGRAGIKQKKSFLNRTISILLGLIFGFVFIQFIEESMQIIKYPPLVEAWLKWSYELPNVRLPYYQIIVIFNSIILGLNLGPGLLVILDGGVAQAELNRAHQGESSEVVLHDATHMLTKTSSPSAGLKDNA